MFGPGKPLKEMANRELVSRIVAFAAIGSVIIIACIASALRNSLSPFFVVWNGIGVAFVITALVSTIPRSVTELRSRRRNCTGGDTDRTTE
jgi:hypothetical protein